MSTARTLFNVVYLDPRARFQFLKVHRIQPNIVVRDCVPPRKVFVQGRLE
jgi:hypothetical protein